MNISKIIAETSTFISEAFARIFSPTDDMYPVVGVQPFSGDPYEKKGHFDW